MIYDYVCATEICMYCSVCIDRKTILGENILMVENLIHDVKNKWLFNYFHACIWLR